MRPVRFAIASFVIFITACGSKTNPEVPSTEHRVQRGKKESEGRRTAVLFRPGDINEWHEFDCLLWNPLESPRRSFLAAKLEGSALRLSGLVLGDELYDQVVRTFVMRGVHIEDPVLGVPGWLALCRKEGIVTVVQPAAKKDL